MKNNEIQILLVMATPELDKTIEISININVSGARCLVSRTLNSPICSPTFSSRSWSWWIAGRCAGIPQGPGPSS